MDCKKMEFSTPSEEPAPIPPPLPGSAKFRFSCRRLRNNGSQSQRGCCSASTTINKGWDCLFDDGYRADVLIQTDYGGVIYAHASILGLASPVFKSILRSPQSRRGRQQKSIPIHGVPPEAVQVFIRFLYSSCYEEEKLDKYALHLLVLSHTYVVPSLKRICEWRLEHGLTTEDVVDFFQLSMLCDAPRLSLLCHRFILKHFEAVFATESWKVMKESHPVLEKEILQSIKNEEFMQKEKVRKMRETKVYQQLYEAMEAVVHVFKDGCRTIGPHDKAFKHDQNPCLYASCDGLESLVRHFAGCKKRAPGGCIHCKRMWQILELHSRLCADPNVCKVPLCRSFKQRRRKQNKKEDTKWRILVRKIVRSKSISGAPFFSLDST